MLPAPPRSILMSRVASNMTKAKAKIISTPNTRRRVRPGGIGSGLVVGDLYGFSSTRGILPASA
jgi:hypothetical protein